MRDRKHKFGKEKMVLRITGLLLALGGLINHILQVIGESVVRIIYKVRGINYINHDEVHDNQANRLIMRQPDSETVSLN